MTPPRFIIDTNVLVAGLITSETSSPTAQILDAMLSGDIFFLLSPALLHEYRSVLLRPKLTRLHQLTAEEIDHLLAAITLNAAWREPNTPVRTAPPDLGDMLLWELLAGDPQAVLVTGDRLLLANPPAIHSVITVADCIARLVRPAATSNPA